MLRNFLYLFLLCSIFLFTACTLQESEEKEISLPVADAGKVQFVKINSIVMLDASASTATSTERSLNYSWNSISAPDGSTSTLSNETSVNPRFLADIDGVYKFGLVVNDGDVDSQENNVSIYISVGNSAPVADAGIDLYSMLGSKVTLDASKSSDADLDSLTYSWTLISKPEKSNTYLEDETQVSPAIEPDIDGIYELSLVVNDGRSDSFLDYMQLTVGQNPTPTSNAGIDKYILSSSLVQLDGSLSRDANYEPLSFNWFIISKPLDSNATLSDKTTLRATYQADVDGAYVIGLVVNNTKQFSHQDAVIINVNNSNRPPIAKAGDAQDVKVGQSVQLDGSSSIDYDFDLLTYRWHISSMPENSKVKLSDSSSVNPTFLADEDGTYIFTLVVTDTYLNSSSSSVSIKASKNNSKPVAKLAQQQNVKTQQEVTLDASKSYDADADTLTYRWFVISKPQTSKINLQDETLQTTTFQADADGLYLVGLVVNDGFVDSTIVTTIINASTINSQPIADAGEDKSTFTTIALDLDSSKSLDADGDSLTSIWRVVSKPKGTSPSLVDARFITDSVGIYVLSLVVDDTQSSSTQDMMIVNTQQFNYAPVADAGDDFSVDVASQVVLDASKSTDKNNDTLTYQWKLDSSPASSNAKLSNPQTQSPTIDIEIDGQYQLSLVVFDGEKYSNPDSMIVTLDSRITHNNIGYVAIKSPHTKRVWLDRNIGASNPCSAFNDTNCYGDYFQWGRDADLHEKSTSTTTATWATSIYNAGKHFITALASSRKDWVSVDLDGELRALKWSKTDGSSVCPKNYRVPTIDELIAETLYASPKVSSRVDAFSGFLKLPSSGLRDFNADMRFQGEKVFVWSSKNGNITGKLFYSNSTNAYADWYTRAYAVSVRCIKD